MNEWTPLCESHQDHAYREFFHPESQARHLGTPGQWPGGIVRKLRLQNPVQQQTFVQLLRGRTPDRQEDLLPRTFRREERVQGWRFSLAREGQLSVLWALSPEQARRIGWAPQQTVKLIREALSQPTWPNRIGNLQRCVRAASLRLRQSHHSPVNIALAHQRPHEVSRPALSQSKPQQQDLGHSH